MTGPRTSVTVVRNGLDGGTDESQSNLDERCDVEVRVDTYRYEPAGKQEDSSFV